MDIQNKNEIAKTLIRCPKCDKALAKIRGNQIYLIQYTKGKPSSTEIEVHHDAGGKFKISCDCGGSFARTVKSLGLKYVVKKPEHK